MSSSTWPLLQSVRVACLACVACAPKGEPADEIIRAVKSATVVQTGGLEQKTFNATAQSGAKTNLSFRTNGVLVKLTVRVGQTVAKGELLAQLDTREISLAYSQAKSTEQSAKMQLETSRSSLERIKSLYESASASLSDYEAAKNSYSSALANHQNSVQSLNLQATQFEYAKVVAPLDGVVSAVNVESGEFVQAGVAAIVIDTNTSDIEVVVGVPEAYVARVENGMNVTVKIGRFEMAGTVTEVGFSAEQSLTYPVTIDVADPEKAVRPGMPSKVTFRFGSADDEKVLSIVPEAVGEDAENRRFVFVLEPKDDALFEVKKVEIDVAGVSAGGFRVRAGLNGGERIATAGLRSLYEGQTVRLLEDPAP
ncbi:MAG: efflux RND transporter periplasmic adaptor subunit [Myxococcota bacterium]